MENVICMSGDASKWKKPICRTADEATKIKTAFKQAWVKIWDYFAALSDPRMGGRKAKIPLLSEFWIIDNRGLPRFSRRSPGGELQSGKSPSAVRQIKQKNKTAFKQAWAVFFFLLCPCGLGFFYFGGEGGIRTPGTLTSSAV